MSSRAVWERVRARVQRFPELLASCGEQDGSYYSHPAMISLTPSNIQICLSQVPGKDSATVYGKCIASNTTEHGNLKKDVCAKEFAMLMDCFTEAAKKNVKT
uniref:IMS import disulfide relay-system CHCH-CHCH-like Cx9C domain-containing protein n=1 Tax=Naja naja TaxID=35670 RepID=A0A8C6X1F0_NAJNA